MKRMASTQKKDRGENFRNWGLFIATIIFTITAVTGAVVVRLEHRDFIESTKIAAKNLELTHRPIVFIQGILVPEDEQVAANPFSHQFVLTNSGRLPAKNVNIWVTESTLTTEELVLGKAHDVPDLTESAIYPNTDLRFQVSPVLDDGGEIMKSQLRVTITYEAEGIPEIQRETMNFIFDDRTGGSWSYVGSKVDIFEEERSQTAKGD